MAWAGSSSGGTRGAKAPDEATIMKAVGSINGIMANVWQQLDERVVACKAMSEKNAQWRDQLELDLVSVSDELASLTGMRTQAVASIQASDIELAKIKSEWDEEVSANTKMIAR